MIVENIDTDIFSICETHLRNDDKIEVDGYQWIGLNRKVIHRNAPKGSGGVGLLIKTGILVDYRFEIVDAEYDGILCIKFISKTTDFTFIVFLC